MTAPTSTQTNPNPNRTVVDLADRRANGISCPTTRKGRGRRPGSIGPTARAIRAAVEDLTDRYDRMTVRQVFYVLEVAGVVEKTNGGYRQVQKQLLAMRRDGLLDWEFITDGTRWQRKPSTWGGALGDYIESVARHYRRDLWRGQGVRIEVWLEKDALADVVVDVTDKWDVSLMVSRGQSSATFLHSAAKTAEREYEHDGSTTVVYTLYDYDAGGERAARTIARDLKQHAPGVPIVVERLAVTPDQIEAWSLPTRPAKRSDPEAASFGEVAVETRRDPARQARGDRGERDHQARRPAVLGDRAVDRARGTRSPLRAREAGGMTGEVRIQLIGCDIDGDTNLARIWWTLRLRDDRLDQGEMWLHVATPRCGWSLADVFYTDIDGFAWPDRDDRAEGVDYWPGWPIDDPDLVEAVRAAIEHELVRVDIARCLLAPVTVVPWRSSVATREKAA